MFYTDRLLLIYFIVYTR